MKRHISTALAAGSVLALVLSACGADADSDDSAPDDRRGPVAVEVGAVGGSGATLAATADAEAGGSAAPVTPQDPATSDLSILPAFGGYVYEVGDGLPALPTADTGYEFPAEATVDAAAVAELASALGVVGDPVPGTGRDGDGALWRVGPDDGSAPSVTVIDDGQLSWYYSSAWALQPGIEPCEAVISEDGEVTEERCPEPVVPEGVPTAAEAEQRVAELLTELGVDRESVEFETYADEWSASVTVWSSRDGIRWPMASGFGFGADAALMWANGYLAEPVPAGPYPLVDLETAIARLDEQGRWWGGLSTTPLPVDDVTGDETTGDETTGDDVTGEESTGDQPLPTEPGEPGEFVEPEPIVATLVDVRADLWWVWDTDGTVWLLPAYTFTDTEGIDHTVPAVTDEFITFADPLVDPMPMPVEPLDPVIVDPAPAENGDDGDAAPGDPLEPIDPEAPEVAGIVGSSVDDATAQLEADGLSLRVARLDGEDLALTMDFVPTRVNVAVEADTVVEIVSVG